MFQKYVIKSANTIFAVVFAGVLATGYPPLSMLVSPSSYVSLGFFLWLPFTLLFFDVLASSVGVLKFTSEEV